MVTNTAKYTMNNFDTEFPNDDACLEYILHSRWPNGIKCSECGVVTKHHRVTGRPCFECDYCGHQVYPTAGTVFHKSSTSLRTWFQSMYLMSSTRCGISAKQIQRETGVTYKTAWRIFKQIRSLLDENYPQFTKEVEVDETYVGGKRHGTRGRGAEGKTPVVGIVERKGKVIAKVTSDVSSQTILPMITNNIVPQTTVYTDEFSSYNKVAKLGYKHLIVRHADKIYVNGEAHTNTIEGFWSLVKRGIDGVYHAVSPKYLQNYVDEYSFRYNHRKDEQPMFKTFLDQIQP
jgi:transposase-like protein